MSKSKIEALNFYREFKNYLFLGLDFGRHRHRSNTAQRLMKMDEERKKESTVRHVKWEKSKVTLTGNETIYCCVHEMLFACHLSSDRLSD